VGFINNIPSRAQVIMGWVEVSGWAVTEEAGEGISKGSSDEEGWKSAI
jgi:hypothetical protein